MKLVAALLDGVTAADAAVAAFASTAVEYAYSGVAALTVGFA